MILMRTLLLETSIGQITVLVNDAPRLLTTKVATPRPANDYVDYKALRTRTPPTVSKLIPIEVQDSKRIWEAYTQGFKNCQQTLCKLIAKAWVKAVEPKKQTAHPYTKNDEGAPDWWPKPWGPTKDEKVRHKEPDHLYKRGGPFRIMPVVNLMIDYAG